MLSAFGATRWLAAILVEPCVGCPTDERNGDENQSDRWKDHATAGEGSAHLARGERDTKPKAACRAATVFSPGEVFFGGGGV